MADIALAATVKGESRHGHIGIGIRSNVVITLGPLPEGWSPGTPTVIPVRVALNQLVFPYSLEYQLRVVTDAGSHVNITGVSYGSGDMNITYTLTTSHVMLYVAPYYGYYGGHYSWTPNWINGDVACELLLPSAKNPRIRLNKSIPMGATIGAGADVRAFTQPGQLVWPGSVDPVAPPGEPMVTTVRPELVQEYMSPGRLVVGRTVQELDARQLPAPRVRGVRLHATQDGIPANG